MALFPWTRGSRRAARIARLADGLLGRHLAVIRDAALPHLAALSPAEARGYIRAKATTMLIAAVRTAPGELAIPATLADAVLSLAAERAVLVLQDQLLRGRVEVGPGRHAA